jgi:hypothetical protein
VAVPNENFSVHGKLQIFTIAGDSGRKKNSKFCPRCGSVVVVEAEGFPGMALIMGGTLDDSTWLNPTMALFCDSEQPWAAVSHEIKRFPGMPS